MPIHHRHISTQVTFCDVCFWADWSLDCSGIRVLGHWINFLLWIQIVTVRLFSIPISAADIERTFSEYKNQHTVKRNRMKSGIVEKVVTVIHHDQSRRISEGKVIAPALFMDNAVTNSVDDIIVDDDEISIFDEDQEQEDSS